MVDPRHLAVGGHVAVDGAAVRRDQALHAQAHTQHGPGRGAQHLASHREVGGFVGVTRTRGQDHVRVPEHVVGRDLVVLDHAR